MTDKCDKNNPNDPHYPDRNQGDYTPGCVWIWDIGFAPDETEDKEEECEQ